MDWRGASQEPRRRLVNLWATRGSGAVTLEEGVQLRRTARLESMWGGPIRLGRGTRIESGALLQSYGGTIVTGERVFIGPNCVLYGHGGLTIGDDTMIATSTVIVPANHNFRDASQRIRSQGLSQRGIEIGRGVWIAAHATVLDGVTIGDGAVVAAGAVVNHDVEPRAVVGGVPARVIGHRR